MLFVMTKNYFEQAANMIRNTISLCHCNYSITSSQLIHPTLNYFLVEIKFNRLWLLFALDVHILFLFYSPAQAYAKVFGQHDTGHY